MALNERTRRATAARTLAALAACLLALGALRVQPLTSIPNPRARDGTWVVDTAGALRPDTVARLNALAGELERTTGVELAVVVVGSLDGLSVEEASVKLFELWGIGKRGRDNGLLLLWSTGDRRVRVEVGYGLEEVLPDGKVGAILDTYVMPRFRTGQFDQGVMDGAQALARAAGGQTVTLPPPRTAAYEPAPAVRAPASSRRPLWLGLLGAVPIGVGSLIGYRRWRRRHRRRCPQCQTRMYRLDEAADDAKLDEGERAEERLGSVDYDVWMCPACGRHLTLRYPRRFSRFDTCPQCLNRTKASTETVLERATVHGEGKAQVVERCEFCSYRVEYTKVLPRRESSSHGGASSGGSGGGASFGGGSSGGGGASRGY